jgi:hypothetical protein
MTETTKARALGSAFSGYTNDGINIRLGNVHVVVNQPEPQAVSFNTT